MSFDRLAPHYRWMEFVLAGNKLQRCRTAFLSHICKARNVLILGEGNGRFLVECKTVLETARITCLDASARMLELARRRLESSRVSLHEIEFVLADALTWVPPKRSFDLIVTHFFLDCFRSDQLERLLSTLASACSAHANWLIADFQIPYQGLRRRRAEIIHRMMYGFFRAAAALPARQWTAPDPFLRAHGFRLRQRLLSDWGLLASDLWERT
jgi:ubiquinone/menaquinone biosynthesis C-methylase UbiE